MGGKPAAPDNSAQIAAAEAQRLQLEKATQDMQKKKDTIAQRATLEAKAKRTRQSGRPSLIATSEQGILGTSDVVG
jgi:PBP1b-binding outer membrane lipoprotein LpoB